MKRWIICLLIYLLGGVAFAELGAHCEGNTLVYYDNNNAVLRRDCSILHSGQGQVFRGICQTYTGGADCWRTAGTVTPEYRDVVRGFVYNATLSAWGPPYSPPTTVTTTTLSGYITTTTLQECPVCSVCPKPNCTSYDQMIFGLNVSFDNCRRNLNICHSTLEVSYSADMYNKLATDFKNEQIRSNSTIQQCAKNLALETSNSGTYFLVMLLSLVILATVVVIWVKYEWIGDPKFKDILDVKPRAKK